RRLLVSPELRAGALLGLLGGPTRDGEKGLPTGFLVEIMEIREEMEAALDNRDDGARERERRRGEAWAADQRRMAIDDVSGMFAALSSPAAPEALRAIRVRLNAWRYVERLIEQLDPRYDPARSDFADPR